MRSLTKFILLISSFIIFIGGCSSKGKTENKKEVMISAAASLSGVLEELKKEYQIEHPDVTIHMNYGGSGKLSQQIIQGAPVDIFLSAAIEPFKQVKAQNILVNEKKLFSNSLVLITLKNSRLNLNDFQDLLSSTSEKIAIGTPDFVPAGLYAKQSLQYLGLWDQLQNKLVFTQDVSQVLHYVESGNTEAGIVYKTDALSSNKVKIISEVNPKWHEPIYYFGGVLKNGKENEEAIKFMKFLSSKKAQKIVKKDGFRPM